MLAALATLEPLAQAYARSDSGAHVTLGTTDASKPVVAALLWRRFRRPLLLAVARESDAEATAEQLRAWAGAAAVHYPARGTLPYTRDATDAEVVRRRIDVLSRLARAGFGADGAPPPLVVASAAAIAEHTLSVADLGRGPGAIAVGDRLQLDEFALALVASGYVPQPIVEAHGQFARRGGLVDVWPLRAELPLRLEFFGPELESLRTFDAESQRTVERIEEAAVGPATEWFPDRDSLVPLAEHLSEATTDESIAERNSLERGELPSPPLYGPLAARSTLLDHLRDDHIVVVDESEAIDAALDELDELAAARHAEMVAQGEFGRDTPFGHERQAAVKTALEARTRYFALARWATGNEPGALRLPFVAADAYAGRLSAAASDAARELVRGDRVVVVTQQAQRYREVLAEHSLDVSVVEALPSAPQGGRLALVQGALPAGWKVATADGIVSLQTDRELFGFVKKRRTLRRRSSHRAQFLADVQPGDFVVHADHGVARFGGIVRRPVADQERDYLELRYAGGDRLYVPVDQVDRVSRYVGPSERPPRLTRLGTQEWSRARARVREAVSIVAADLVRLYAARQMLTGHAFSPDQEWQREMEAAFPYEETEDQRAVIAAVKADMESPRPMDRVICGDVGFGKTEVAVRVAFKAMLDGFQVAVLVPTTVLAQQHERTFRERLAAFPVRIEVLSRFRSDADARAVLAVMRRGDVDIVIGTHRLLQDGVEFKNLGLVIIDEEQRFGVAHKERLKRMRLEVDVLTLSATPIPRTLHMALGGIRDMSTMETAPEGRQPVQTYVAEWDESMVRDALLQEIERGGQVYAVHNRVHSIEEYADRLRRLVPEARIVVGHGQMPENLLKRVMERFADGEYDVLVCTTIIESGIDIPNVNTLVIDQADKLGLAQLYQLRGRVGRGTHQAIAYLLHARDRVLSEEAQQRLSTIFEANELGSGLQVALRDLEIRGAGNLLGAEQSGQIATVGFDLYTQMLAEAVESLKAAHDGRDPQRAEPAAASKQSRIAIDLPVAAFIPEQYISEIEARLALYQRVAGLTSRAETQTLRAEVEDRFGALPEPLDSLLAVVDLRIAARAADVASVRLDGEEVVITATDDRSFAGRAMPGLPATVRVGRSQLRASRPSLGADWLPAIAALLRVVAGELDLVPA